VVNTDNLAQASLPRLGEMSRGSPKAFYASCRSGDQTLVLSEQMSRLGGGGLALARLRMGYCSPCRALA